MTEDTSPDEVEKLIADLNSTSHFLFITSAAQRLGEIGDARAVRPLMKRIEIDLLDWTNPNYDASMRTNMYVFMDSAVIALGKIIADRERSLKSPTPIVSLFSGKTIPLENLREAVIKALIEFLHDTETRTAYRWPSSDFYSYGEATVGLEWFHCSVAKALGEIGDTRTIEAALQFLNDLFDDYLKEDVNRKVRIDYGYRGGGKAAYKEGGGRGKQTDFFTFADEVRTGLLAMEKK